MFENINEIVFKDSRIIAIKNSEEFYFQKGQDALNSWLALDVSEQQQILLQGLVSDYNQFIRINENFHPELIEIKSLLYKIISYCDDKARDKNEFNEYEDKRTLARAGVRMAPWIKNLVNYKFDRANVSGSIKNAFDYLLDPIDNSTVLSENHREFIVTHYLSKPYNPNEFVADLKVIFNEYNINVVNDINYTLLLSAIIYIYEDKWRPKKSMTFSELIEELKKYIIENKIKFNILPFESKQKYIWLSDKYSVIGSSVAHFEVGKRGKRENKDTVFVDLHFESENKIHKELFYNTLKELPEELEWIDWFNSKSIGFKENFKLGAEDNIVEKIVGALERIDETIGDKVRAIINSIPHSSEKEVHNQTNNSEKMENPLNQILYGPPGTGKTFHTINEALKIVDRDYYLANKKDRKKLTDRFKELLINNTVDNKGQIAFCTFHQSFSYEDFVEGIKPKTSENKGVYYETESGIFKKICQLADSNNSIRKVKKEGKFSWNQDQFHKSSFYKLSLGEASNSNDREIYEYCRDNNYIAIGFGLENNFEGLSESEITTKCQDLNFEPIVAQQLNYFIHYLKKDNYVIISNGNKYIRAIGKVVGDYEYWEESPIRYNHFRKVEWLFVDELIPIEEIYERGLSQKTMYKIDEKALKPEFFTNQGQEEIEENREIKNYVIIIDEINRGNVSSIFGELITLIEKDKRAGNDEELEVTLPYSKESFKVPANVYIIGTMNTADRSIEALDTALRRRFSFKEMPPQHNLILAEGKLKEGKIGDIDVVKVLETINNRIEKLIDKDHKIGHSYFLGISNESDLIEAFKNKVIPLLEEYFFGDFGKISLVLGSSFITKTSKEKVTFAKDNEYDSSIAADLLVRSVYEVTPSNTWNFKAIYE